MTRVGDLLRRVPFLAVLTVTDRRALAAAANRRRFGRAWLWRMLRPGEPWSPGGRPGPVGVCRGVYHPSLPLVASGNVSVLW